MKEVAAEANPRGSCSCGEQALLLTFCCAALGTLVPIALHQLGVVEHLPDPPGRLFDSDRITESRMAHPLGIPDSLLGMASYGTTLALILAARRCSVGRKLLAGKLVVDGGAAAFNAVRQVVHFGRICSWCTGTALATGAMIYAGREVVAGSGTVVLAGVRD